VSKFVADRFQSNPRLDQLYFISVPQWLFNEFAERFAVRFVWFAVDSRVEKIEVRQAKIVRSVVSQRHDVKMGSIRDALISLFAHKLQVHSNSKVNWG